MSTGLIYPPGSFATTDEVITLSRILARRGAVYTSHIRGEGDTVLESLDEAVRIGRESGARVQVSHLKALGQRNWGRGREALARLEEARRTGVDVGADQYPYTATSTSLEGFLDRTPRGRLATKLCFEYFGKMRSSSAQERLL